MCVKLFRLHFPITVKRNRIKFGMVIAPDSGSLSPNLGEDSYCTFGVINMFAWLHSKYTCMVKVVTPYTCVHKVFDFISP